MVCIDAVWYYSTVVYLASSKHYLSVQGIFKIVLSIIEKDLEEKSMEIALLSS